MLQHNVQSRNAELGDLNTCGFIVIGLLVSGCVPLSDVPARQMEPEPNYRQLVAENVANLLKLTSLLGLLEAPSLRPCDSVQPGDWMMCVRSTATDGKTAHFSFFFRDRKIEAVRRAVGFDGCEAATYEAMPRSTAVK
jgi:hypothetical protein